MWALSSDVMSIDSALMVLKLWADFSKTRKRMVEDLLHRIYSEVPKII